MVYPPPRYPAPRRRPPQRGQFWLALVVLLTLGLEQAVARIKLVTLPVREQVIIQLDHESATLVEEERIVPLVAGVNQVDFSWANTRIDPNTILFRVVTDAPDQEGQAASANAIEVLSVSYPPGENALVWSIAAERSGPARVRISYLMQGLEKSIHYRAVAANDETSLALSQYLRVINNANEGFDSASIWAGFGDRIERPLGRNESKEVLIGQYGDVEVRKTYTIDPVEIGYLDRAKDQLKVPMHYAIDNNAAANLGQAALPYGKARIFQRDSQGTTAFIGEDWAAYTPPGDELELFLGLARDVVAIRTIESRERERITNQLYRYHVVVKYELENFKPTPVTLKIREPLMALKREANAHSGRLPHYEIGAQTTLGEPNAEESDANTLIFGVDLPPQGEDQRAVKQTHRLHLTFHNEW